MNQLDHPFRIIAFDWDGTAVMSRQEDAEPIRQHLETLLRLGVWIVVTTGTNFPNIDRQLSAAIVGPHKQRLYVCTNRGSEVYGFDAQSRPVLLWNRVASSEENRLLTEIADGVRRAIEGRTGLDVHVTYSRLNRRKIDLIPLPEWRDPPKSAIGDLLHAVEARLIGSGIAGGLREVFALTEQLAREKGLPESRITSDVKHVEVGLTDKGDSIAWMMAELADKHGIRAQDIMIGGDEFGPIAGLHGSDYKMATAARSGVVFVSVGIEPNGVPPEVIHIEGGPARFRELLEQQIYLHESSTDQRRPRQATVRAIPGQMRSVAEELPADPPARSAASPDQKWLLIEEGFEPAREHEIESFFTVANGYLGTRGSLQEGSGMSRPATFVAGVFHTPPDSVPEPLPAPDWARFKVFVAGEELQLSRGEMLEHRRMLDMRRGVLERTWRHRDHVGRITSLQFQRFASLADRHALVESVIVSPENYGGPLRVESIVDGTLTDEGGQVRVRIVDTPSAPGETQPGRDGIARKKTPVLTVRSSRSGTRVSFASATVWRSVGDAESAAVRSELRGQSWIGDRWDWEGEIGRSYRVDKLVAVYSSRDVPHPVQSTAQHLSHLVTRGADVILEEHSAAWIERQELADVQIAGDYTAQRAIRFATYHLIASANPTDERVSIGARALTGEAYKAHVFWDTEIYMLPFYIFTHPPSARALLMYRYHTLPAAREKARVQGYRGALYPWESTDTGEEATPPYALTPEGEVIPILSGLQEHHISADVAYAVWQYWQGTNDDDFFLHAGAEIMLETARFWAGRVEHGADGRYHIRKVIGPDEYHEGVDDNAYTNGMARWNLEHGLKTAEILSMRWPERWGGLLKRLAITDEETGQWLDIAQRMYTGFDPTTGLFEQFRGYFDLERVDLQAYEPRTAPMDVLLGRERIAQTQIIKQPDVVMLIYLLWDQFSPQVREANFRYYEPRCGHGSSLSPSIHALVASRLGDLALAERYFIQAAEIDLANNMGNAAGGVHAAAQGGLWQAVVFGFGGLRPLSDGLAFDPHHLSSWQKLSFPVQWQGRRLRVTSRATPATLDILLEQGDNMVVTVGRDTGARRQVSATKRYRSRRANGAWTQWREVPR